MADTINVVSNVAVSFPSVGQTESFNFSKSVTPASSVCHTDEQAVPTSAGGTVVPLGPVGTAGLVKFLNVDPTNYCEVGIVVTGTFQPVAKLLAGGGFGSDAMFYVADGVALYWRGHTAAPNVKMLVCAR